jgi:hypothetical protein
MGNTNEEQQSSSSVYGQKEEPLLLIDINMKTGLDNA